MAHAFGGGQSTPYNSYKGVPLLAFNKMLHQSESQLGGGQLMQERD
jgi:hypothetical protein